MERARTNALIEEFLAGLGTGAEAPLREQASFTDLGVDSLSLVDLLFLLERRVGVEIPDDALPDISTVGDLLDFVTGRVSRAGRH